MKVYVAGPLTDLTEDKKRYVKRVYTTLKNIFEKYKEYEVSCYLPMRKTDPVRHANLPSRKVRQNDLKQVANSDLLILYSGYPSFGAGRELGLAEERGIPVLFLVEEEKKVSRMIDDSPNIEKTIRFKSIEDLECKFEEWLIKKISEKNLEGFAYRDNIPYREYSQLKDLSTKREKPISIKEYEKWHRDMKVKRKSLLDFQK